MYPMTYPTQNSHRVVLLTPERKLSETTRLTDMTADALDHAREALSLTPGLEPDTQTALRAELRAVERHVTGRRILSDVARADLSAFIEAARYLLDTQDPEEILGTMLHAMGEAYDRSLRVTDLIAAEAEIAALRAPQS